MNKYKTINALDIPEKMKEKDEAIQGCVSLKKNKKELHVGLYIPRIGMFGSVKTEGRDVIPSPYTTGLLDKFLESIVSLCKFFCCIKIRFGLLPSLICMDRKRFKI